MLLVSISSRNTGDPSGSVVAPSGWTRLGYNRTFNPVGFQDSIVVYGKDAAGGETSVTVDFPNTDGNDVFVEEWSDASIVDYILVSETRVGSGTSMTGSSVSVVGTGLVWCHFAQSQDNSKSFSAGTGWTLAQEDEASSHPATIIVYAETTDATVLPAATSNRTNGWRAVTLVFGVAPEPEEPPDPPEAEDAPVPGMWVDWGLDGFGVSVSESEDAPLARMLPEGGGGADVEDNITPDVKRVVIHRGGFADHLGGTSPGTMTVTVKNEDGKYNPDNADSPVYPLVKPDLSIWFGVNADGTVEDQNMTVYGRFGGYVREIVPMPVPGSSYEAQLICDDAFGRWRQATARVEFMEDPSIAEAREAVLDALDETRFDLDTEADHIAFFGTTGTRTRTVTAGTPGQFVPTQDVLRGRIRQPTANALALLEELNALAGTRHFIEPGDTKEDWYQYRTVNRHHKLDDSPDADIDGEDHGAATSGYRATRDTVINVAEVEVRPTTVDGNVVTVWRYGQVPFDVGPAASVRIIIADFGDYVFDAALSVAATGSVTSAFTPFGDGALIRLDAAAEVTVTALTVTGRLVRRSDAETIERTSTSSRNRYGERRQSISSDYMQSTGLAKGIAEFVLWKFAEPLTRPRVDLINTLSKTLPLELYDVLTLTIDRLHVAGRRFEMIGLHEEWQTAAVTTNGPLVFSSFSFELQETPNQTALSFFRVDISSLDGTDGLAP